MICLDEHKTLGDGVLPRFGNKVGFRPAIKERNRSPPFGNDQVAFDNFNVT